jgi:hypothetical protein
MNEQTRIESKAPSIKATVRRSEKDPMSDAWLTVELSAERTVTNLDPADDIKNVAQLARDLDAQLGGIFLDNVGTEPEGSVCPEHGEEYRQFTKNGSSWWSHQTESGTWCKRAN